MYVCAHCHGDKILVGNLHIHVMHWGMLDLVVLPVSTRDVSILLSEPFHTVRVDLNIAYVGFSFLTKTFAWGWSICSKHWSYRISVFFKCPYSKWYRFSNWEEDNRWMVSWWRVNGLCDGMYVCISETVLSIVLLPELFDMTLCSSRGAGPELNLWQLQTVGGPVPVTAVCPHSFWGQDPANPTSTCQGPSRCPRLVGLDQALPVVGVGGFWKGIGMQIRKVTKWWLPLQDSHP